jgi:hypothetical protein
LDGELEGDDDRVDVDALTDGLEKAVTLGEGAEAPPSKSSVRTVAHRDRTKVLTVEELEDLFWAEAPDLAS